MAPGTETAIAEAETRLACRFPADDVAFLSLTDRYNGFVGADERYLAAWDVSSLHKLKPR